MPKINFLVFENCMASGIIGPREVLSIANSIAEERSDSIACFEGFEVASSEGIEVCGFAGSRVEVGCKLSDINPDILIIPPCFGDVDPLLNDQTVKKFLLERIDKGTVVATVCAGSFLLAGTGYLDRKIATTHWKLADNFRKRFPQVDLQPQQMLIDGGGYICAGGAMAWQDLALHLISRFMGRDVASSCAKILVMDSTRHVQTPYFMFDQQKEASGFADKNITEVQKWMQENYRESISTEEMARLAGLGMRTFLRRFKRATGLTPGSYLQQLRVEAARHLLEVSNKGVDEITIMIGYENSSSFRRLFKKKTGLNPGEYRSRFGRSDC